MGFDDLFGSLVQIYFGVVLSVLVILLDGVDFSGRG